MQAAKGARGGRSKLYKAAKETAERGHAVRLSRSAEEEGRVPHALDHPDQRGGAHPGYQLQPAHGWASEGRVDINRKVLADLAVHEWTRLPASPRWRRTPTPIGGSPRTRVAGTRP